MRVPGFTHNIVQSLKQQHICAEVDKSDSCLSKQIRNSELDKIPFTIVIGQRELDEQNLSVRTRAQGDLGTMTLPQLTEERLKAIANKSANY